MSDSAFDLVIIGAGPGGYVAAAKAVLSRRVTGAGSGHLAVMGGF